MSESRKSFLLHFDSLCILDDLTDEQAGKLLRAMRDYHLGNEVDLDPLLKIAFSPFKNQFIRDQEKYQTVVERNKANGAKGGRPKKPKKPTGLNGNPKNPLEPKKADNDSGNDSDSDNKSDNKRTRSRFTPPTLEEVKNYCLERKNQVNPIRFVNYYESNGWSVGKNKMKCWKAAVRNWETKENNSRPVQQDLSQQNFVSGKF